MFSGILIFAHACTHVCVYRISSCSGQVSLLFYSDLQLIGRGPPHYGGESALLSQPIKMLISSKNTLIETCRIMFDQLSGHHGPAKLTHKTITDCF